jgi:hypothetical protein
VEHIEVFLIGLFVAVAGLSTLARRLQIQERMTNQIASTIQDKIQPLGVDQRAGSCNRLPHDLVDVLFVELKRQGIGARQDLELVDLHLDRVRHLLARAVQDLLAHELGKQDRFRLVGPLVGREVERPRRQQRGVGEHDALALALGIGAVVELPADFGVTAVIPGFGFLADLFPEEGASVVGLDFDEERVERVERNDEREETHR